MRIALLCPGGSLRLFPGRDGFDTVVAVNRAAFGLWPVDWWVALDHYTPSWGDAAARMDGKRPTLVMAPSEMRRLVRAEPKYADWPAFDPAAIRREQDGSDWHKWSATMALALAADLGAREVHVWGMDWCGLQDWDGFSSERQQRGDARWTRTAAAWRALARALASEGVEVVRTVLEGAG